MIVAVKLDSCTFYVKIWIWPFLDRIIPSIFKMIHPRITNKLNGHFLSLFLKPLEFFSCQQSSPTTLDESSSLLFRISSLQRIFSSLFEACWALTVAVNTSNSCFISPRIRDRLLDSFFRTLISLFLSLWYHLSFWILIFFCHNTSSKYMKSLRFLGCLKPSRSPMVSSLKPPSPISSTLIRSKQGQIQILM